jgi:hypothetical protein
MAKTAMVTESDSFMGRLVLARMDVKHNPRSGVCRITIGVAEVASAASNLSEARRSARFYSSFPARVRASE